MNDRFLVRNQTARKKKVQITLEEMVLGGIQKDSEDKNKQATRELDVHHSPVLDQGREDWEIAWNSTRQLACD